MLRTTFGAASRSEFLERQVTARKLTRSVALRFVAGETIDDAVGAVERLSRMGLRATLDVLGEAHAESEEIEASVSEILRAVSRLSASGLPAGISVKPTQVGLVLSEEVAHERLSRVAGATDEAGTHLTLDMEDHTLTERTVGLVEGLLKEGHRSVGCAVQAYLRRTSDDVRRLSEQGATLRLCKGAYDEPKSVAYRSRQAVDASFRAAAELLLQQGTYPRIATHDGALISHVQDVAASLSVPRDAFEFQMLYGIREPLQRELVEQGYRVCVYVPYGPSWYRYFMRRLGERPANLGFFLRAVASG